MSLSKKDRQSLPVRVCRNCGQQVFTAEPQLIYCSPACRQAAYRRRQKDAAAARRPAGRKGVRRGK